MTQRNYCYIYFTIYIHIKSIHSLNEEFNEEYLTHTHTYIYNEKTELDFSSKRWTEHIISTVSSMYGRNSFFQNSNSKLILILILFVVGTIDAIQ